MATRILVVQQGHCYRTRGATGTAGLPGGPTEQEFATAAAIEVARLVDGRRDTGGDVWRVRRILADEPGSRYRGDAFVALHCDGSVHASARGASVGYQGSAGRRAAVAWREAYDARGWTGFRPDNYTPGLAGYYGVRIARQQGNPRAWIVEAGFLTSPADHALLAAPGGPTRVALAIADALSIPTEEDPMADYADQLDEIHRQVTQGVPAQWAGGTLADRAHRTLGYVQRIEEQLVRLAAGDRLDVEDLVERIRADRVTDTIAALTAPEVVTALRDARDDEQVRRVLTAAGEVLTAAAAAGPVEAPQD